MTTQLAVQTTRYFSCERSSTSSRSGSCGRCGACGRCGEWPLQVRDPLLRVERVQNCFFCSTYREGANTKRYVYLPPAPRHEIFPTPPSPALEPLLLRRYQASFLVSRAGRTYTVDHGVPFNVTSYTSEALVFLQTMFFSTGMGKMSAVCLANRLSYRLCCTAVHWHYFQNCVWRN